jgi:hypothetical protein
MNAIAGIHKDSLSGMADGEQKQLQLDTFGRLIVTSGAGAPGAAGGEVQSVQGVSGMIPMEVRTGTHYETVAASQTDQVMGATGATGDYLAGVLVVPATTAAGAISIKDGSGSAITLFTGGAGSVSNLVPFFIPLGANSTVGAWKVSTGANVSAIAVGRFT